MRIQLFLSLFLLSSAANLLQAQNGRMFGSFENNDEDFGYAYYLPSNYDTAKVYPVLIGPGEGVKGSEKSFFWNTDNPGQFGWILVEFPTWKHNSNIVKDLMKDLLAKYKVEGEKFHIVGFSANSASTFSHAISNPDFFHSVTGAPGHPSAKKPEYLKSLQIVRIQNIVGENDSYWLGYAREFEEAYKAHEVKSILDIVPQGEHVMPQLVGAPFMEKIEALRVK